MFRLRHSLSQIPLSHQLQLVSQLDRMGGVPVRCLSLMIPTTHTSSAASLPPIRHTPSVLYVLGVEDDFRVPTFISDSIFLFLGFSADEVMCEQWWYQQLSTDDHTGMRNAVRQAYLRGASRSKLQVRHKDGSAREVDCQIRAVHGSTIHPRQILCTWTHVMEPDASNFSS